MLKNRKNAMDEAVKSKLSEHSLTLDYYDSQRIATWVRNYPSLVLWVRDRIGEPIIGWKSYDNWTNPSGGVEEDYIIDDKVRLFYKGKSENNVVDGINRMRELLRKPKTSVRLAGLSGVGKTRFVQALFDDRIGSDALSENLVVYTDISWEPSPTPRTFAEQIIAKGDFAIIIIDNCAPAIHQALTEVCERTDSCISLLTVEYDITDEPSSETEAFSLEPASDELITELIQSRFPTVDSANAERISQFSGGNAKIAIALAKTVEAGENLLTLNDSLLFDRLFWQRNNEDDNLRKVAEASALVYSFNSDINDNSDNELAILSSLVNMSSSDFYRCITTLLKRDLMQQRNRWRAVLPHAIANKMAAQALENIPSNFITNAFAGDSRERLMLSFIHRLSYLHNSKEARDIAESLLSETSILGDFSDLRRERIKILSYVASTVPDLVLQKYQTTDISRLTELHSGAYIEEHMRIIANLAYDEANFISCMELLTKCVLGKRKISPLYNNHWILLSFFQLFHSGTKASPEQRLSFVKGLVTSNETEKVELGFELIGSALSTENYPNRYTNSFGSHNRDSGYKPENNDEYDAWYQHFIGFLMELILEGGEIGYRAQAVLSEKARRLCWGGLYKLVVAASEQIRTKIFWPTGYVALHEIMKYDEEKMSTSIAEELNNTKLLLAPSTDEEKAILLVSTRYGDHHDDFEDMSVEQSSAIAENVGKTFATQPEKLTRIISESVKNNSWLSYNVGRGISLGSENHRAVWDIMHKIYCEAPLTQRNDGMLGGFINALYEANPDLCNDILDAVSKDYNLKNRYPYLQNRVPLDNAAISRIKCALLSNIHDAWSYANLHFGRLLTPLAPTLLEEILVLIANKPDGFNVATELFYHSFYDEIEKGTLSCEYRALGRKLILLFDFAPKKHYGEPAADYHMLKVFKYCFSNQDESRDDTMLLLTKLYEIANDNVRLFYDYHKFFRALTKIAPIEYLNTFLNDDIKVDSYYLSLIGGDRSDAPFLDEVDAHIIIEWCALNPEVRYVRIAQVLAPFERKGGEYAWKCIAKHMLSHAINITPILDAFYKSLWPSSWSGSRALIVEPRTKLIEELCDNDNDTIKRWAIGKLPIMQQHIKATLKQEEDMNRVEERFE